MGQYSHRGKGPVVSEGCMPSIPRIFPVEVRVIISPRPPQSTCSSKELGVLGRRDLCRQGLLRTQPHKCTKKNKSRSSYICKDERIHVGNRWKRSKMAIISLCPAVPEKSGNMHSRESRAGDGVLAGQPPTSGFTGPGPSSWTTNVGLLAMLCSSISHSARNA